MNILSLSFGHDGLAAVVVDGKLVAAIASERISRVKKQRGVTRETINYVLEKAGLKWAQLHLVVVTNWFWDRGLDGRELYDKAANGVNVTLPDGQPLTHERFKQIYQGGSTIMGMFTFRMGNDNAPCMMADHHFSHAAYAFHMSPFDDALVISIDGSDNEGSNHAIHFFDDKSSRNFRLRRGGCGPAHAYSLLTDYLGFYPSLTDAGKVMALAAYGKVVDGIDDLAEMKEGSPWDVLGGDLYLHILTRAGVRDLPWQRCFWPQLKGEGGTPDSSWRKKHDWRSETTTQIAATMQTLLERWTLKTAKELVRVAGRLSENLCLVGGTALNCVNNGKLLNSGVFKNVYLAPASGDDGLAIGAAIEVGSRFEIDSFQGLRPRVGPNQPRKKTHTALEAFEGGRRYSTAEIEAAIGKARGLLRDSLVEVQRYDEASLVNVVAQQITESRIIGWFYRGSELGPRALGHRSILANACNPNMKDILNHRVKHREEFRPFAPVVLIEHANEWFDLPPGYSSPFMLFSVQCKKPDVIPSAVHIDGTARVQTVDPQNNGRFYNLIVRLKELTGVPIVLNTSFNVQSEPIVESPEDAIRCFLGTEIDTLVLDDYVLQKPVSAATPH